MAGLYSAVFLLSVVVVPCFPPDDTVSFAKVGFKDAKVIFLKELSLFRVCCHLLNEGVTRADFDIVLGRSRHVSKTVELRLDRDTFHQVRMRGSAWKCDIRPPEGIWSGISGGSSGEEREERPPHIFLLLKKGANERSGINISPMTTRQRIKEFGFSCRTPTKKPFLKPYMVKKRLSWAKQHQSWTVDDWKKVCFSDESTIPILADKSVFVRRRKGEQYNNDCIMKAVKHPLSIMVWSIVSGHGTGRLYFVQGMMRQYQYIKVLKERLLSQVHEWFPDGDFVFIHVSAPCHKANKVTKFLSDNKIKVLDWPVEVRKEHRRPALQICGVVEIYLHFTGLDVGSEIRLRKPAITAGDHRANHTIPPFWLDDRPPLLRQVAVKPAAGWSVLALRGL
ncbi:hypothetical protein ANN_00477 [Periplaneta americana]|uniref:Transposase Tc1-like domain-containing protein n=1 Tax=Periplaneta americana TaxID=6978 RepID=A0ABQ8TR10_PERAM|nr:hypothetical protein ANN_00477 [Periplaneta americana]